MKRTLNPKTCAIAASHKRRTDCWLYIALLGSLLAVHVHSQPIVIGYTNCLEVTNYSQSLMNEIGQLKWYFAHASVGLNMMRSIKDLHEGNPTFYQLQGIAEDDTPPDVTSPGAIYDYYRENSDWKTKIDTFQSYVSNGWCFPKINLAMNKLCFIDWAADLNYYLNSMKVLEAANPETVFVYVTIPLTTNATYETTVADIFNEGLRAFARSNDCVLFDIADMESHDTNGVPGLFIWTNGVVYPRMCDCYTEDGGHLNDAGRQLIGWGFYSLAAALFATDRDKDGISDGQELIAGTRPVDPQSGFTITAVNGTSEQQVVIECLSAFNRYYTLERSTNLTGTTSFSGLLMDVPGTPPMNSFTDSPPDGGAAFYRLRVRQ